MEKFKLIPTKNLIVNPENDRHGALETEEQAINWLLKNKTDKMRALAKDIAITGKIYETPLVKDEDKCKYIVYDGNRRITCLKILSGLCDCYDLYDKEYYIKLRNDYQCYDKLPREVYCEINRNQAEIDEIIRRRHAPTNSGEIKLNWEPYEKEIFLIRTGKSDKINFAKEIQDILQDKELLSNQDKIPLSNYNRLFSSEKYRKLAGVSIKNNKIVFIVSEEKALNVLSYIARLMISGEISLKDILNDDLKMNVFTMLQERNMLPKISDQLKEPKEISKEKIDKKDKNKTPKLIQQLSRDTLLSKSLIQPKQNQYCTAKIYNLFIELQYDLLIKKHINAISISFRVLLELLTHAYANKNGIIFRNEEKLSNKIGQVFDHIQSPKKDEENVKFIKNLSQTNKYFSTGTLNSFVHSLNILPVAQDLISFADNFEKYISLVIENLNEDGGI